MLVKEFFDTVAIPEVSEAFQKGEQSESNMNWTERRGVAPGRCSSSATFDNQIWLDWR